MNPSTLGGVAARHILGAAGGALVAKGWIAASMVEPLTGAVMLIGTVIWSILQKRRAE